MDGVLVDSTPTVARIWSQWAVEHGFDPQEVVGRAQGRPSISTIREYLPDSDIEAENKIVEQRECSDTDGVIALPGALELLAALPHDRWTIVTGCTRPLAAVRIAAGKLPAPDNFITSSDYVNGKPHPDPFLMGAKLLGFDAADCVVFEDAPAGVQAGKAAGCRVIAFRSTVKDDQVLLDAGADFIIDNASQLRLTVTPDERSLLLLELDEEHLTRP